eukprot:1605115-Ditylum_brightwellii.AAC.1
MTPLHYGASMDIVLNKYKGEDVELNFQAVGGQEIVLPVTHESNATDTNTDLYHSTRSNFFKKIHGLCVNNTQSYNDRMANMFKLSDEIKTARVQSTYIDSLCKDMEGQATEAVSKKEWYDRWGRHYLLSLGGAHQHQFCNNFKDPGVQ